MFINLVQKKCLAIHLVIKQVQKPTKASKTDCYICVELHGFSWQSWILCYITKVTHFLYFLHIRSWHWKLRIMPIITHKIIHQNRASNGTLNDTRTQPCSVVFNIHGYMLNYKSLHGNKRSNSSLTLSRLHDLKWINIQLFPAFQNLCKKFT